MTNSYRVAALIASHNRRDKTVYCIERLTLACPPAASLRVFLADDASTDGTPEEVRRRFPDCTILTGSGDLFWSRSMAMAWDTASLEDFDAYLWVNDDVEVYAHSLEVMLETLRKLQSELGDLVIVAGALLDPETGDYMYGVSSRPYWWHPRFKGGSLLFPHASQPIEAFSFHGNLVLIPRAVFRAVGGIDARYSHGMGDTDYAFRAQRYGVRVFAAPGFMGTCPSNPDTAVTLRDRLSRKATPWRDWLYFSKKHAHPLIWPAAFFSPYIGAVMLQLRLRRPSNLHGGSGRVT